jgi:hypothetical protein
MRKVAAEKKKRVLSKRKKGVSAEAEYLTKRVLVTAVSRGFRTAAAATMEVQGYNVIAEDGWVVKVYADGRKERIKKIASVKRPDQIELL